MSNRVGYLTYVFEQLVIYSLLIDDDGLVQGWRIISDPRELPQARINADSIALPLKIRFGGRNWTCVDLPRREGEQPLAGTYMKERCEQTSEGRYITMETHRYLQPGQRSGAVTPQEGEFEVWVRLEVINAELVTSRN